MVYEDLLVFRSNKCSLHPIEMTNTIVGEAAPDVDLFVMFDSTRQAICVIAFIACAPDPLPAIVAQYEGRLITPEDSFPLIDSPSFMCSCPCYPLALILSR